MLSNTIVGTITFSFPAIPIRTYTFQILVKTDYIINAKKNMEQTENSKKPLLFYLISVKE